MKLAIPLGLVGLAVLLSLFIDVLTNPLIFWAIVIVFALAMLAVGLFAQVKRHHGRLLL